MIQCCNLIFGKPNMNYGRHREFIFIVGYNFGTSVSLPLLSLYLSLSLSVSLLLSPKNSPIYLSLSHTLLISLSFFPPFSFFPFKTIQPMWRVWERVIYWGVSRWEKEGDWKRDREREGGMKQMCQNCIPTMNMNSLCTEHRWYKKRRLTKNTQERNGYNDTEWMRSFVKFKYFFQHSPWFVMILYGMGCNLVLHLTT